MLSQVKHIRLIRLITVLSNIIGLLHYWIIALFHVFVDFVPGINIFGIGCMFAREERKFVIFI